ncbi:MAG: hypothetical protein HOI01_11665, partial [Proteobacteria bacterium]|nr:hypothetical protein [Pseudomonadota bacterium]
MTGEFSNYDAIGLGELVQRGEASPAELLDATIENIEKINPTINAVVHKMYEQAHETAKEWSVVKKKDPSESPIFCGVPFLLKD